MSMTVSPDSPLKIQPHIQLEGMTVRFKFRGNRGFGFEQLINPLYIKEDKEQAAQELYSTLIFSATQEKGMLQELAQLIAEYVPPMLAFPQLNVAACPSMAVMCFVPTDTCEELDALVIDTDCPNIVYQPEEETSDDSAERCQTVYVAPQNAVEQGVMIHLFVMRQDDVDDVDTLMRQKMQAAQKPQFQ